jgi:electron transport complex protein RnfG
MNQDTEDPQDLQRQHNGVKLPLIGLLAVAVLSVTIVSFVEQRTRTRISVNEADRARKAIAATLPPAGYDNQPHRDQKRVAAPEYLGTEQLMPVYRARNGERLVAVVLTAEAPDGYVAPIRLLVGIDTDGRIIAVRATSHQETPGLGDAIDADRSGWIEIFNGRTFQEGLSESGQRRLALKKDGGDIDHITGATITSRAVTNAVRKALQFYTLARGTLADKQQAD